MRLILAGVASTYKPDPPVAVSVLRPHNLVFSDEVACNLVFSDEVAWGGVRLDSVDI